MLPIKMLSLLFVVVVAAFVAAESVEPVEPYNPLATEQDARYFGAVPRVLYAGAYSSISLSIASLKNDATITVRLLEPGAKNEVAKYSIVITPPTNEAGIIKRIPFYVPDTLPLRSSACTLAIEAQGGLSFKHSVTNLEVKLPKDKIIIQTDKPLYKPGGKVKFRVIAIDKDLKPSPMPVEEIFITNPTGSRMMQWTNASLDNGVISLEMPLSVKPVLGEWKISAKSQGIVGEQTLVVKKYVMPKFEVTITSPPYILKKDKSVTFKICAKYTYGKLVSGKLNIDICCDSYHHRGHNMCQNFQKKINGCENVVYNVNCNGFGAVLKANATVTEDGTTAAITEDHVTQPFVDSDVVMTFEVPQYYKPGFMFKIKLLLNTPDGRPIVENKRVNFEIKRKVKNRGNYARVVKRTVIVSKGVHEETIVPLANSEYYTYEASYQYQTTQVSSYRYGMVLKRRQSSGSSRKQNLRIQTTRAYGTMYPWFSPSQSFMQISSVSDVVVGSTARISVQFSSSSVDTPKDLNYIVVCRGSILVASMERISVGSNAFLHFAVTQAMVPKCRILIYYISADGEFVSDNKIVTFDTSFRNKVSMAFSSDEKKPGEKVGLILKAEPGSLFAIAAVDKSILLMASNNDVNKEQLLLFLNDQDVASGTSQAREKCARHRRWSHEKDSEKVDGTRAIKETGLRYFTNARVDVLPCPRFDYYRPRYQLYLKLKALQWSAMESFVAKDFIRHGSGPAPRKKLQVKLEAKPIQSTTTAKTTTPSTLPKVRTEFPETWLWAEEIINSSGEKKLAVQIPDTITTWHANGFAISPSFGIGVASSTNIRAFQPFFVSLSLPYSVKRGETVKIPATVFNYLDKCLVVEVTLKQTSDFVAVSKLSTKLCICGGSSKSFKFNIKATSLGKIDINVGAHTLSPVDSEICNPNSIVASDVTAADALTRKLLVEAEGIKKEYSKSVFFCPEDSTSRIYTHTLSLTLPKSVVPGSVFAELAVTGELLGPSMDGLDKLLAMPYGCGEQNMLKFAPNIYILDYLTATDQVTPTIEKKAKTFMASGYQRELTYKHSNGAYSAFGERDKEGSTWLTAFVLRTYAQARRYIFIDPKDIKDSTTWLLSLQLSSGCFKEVGMVHHKEMKGGVTSGITMTAFVLIALLEAETPRNDVRIQNAVKCIEGQLSDVKDFYTASVLAFALKYGGSSKAELMLEMLKDGAITDKEGTHWEDKSKKKKVSEGEFLYHHQARSADIETTAYALMVYVGGREPFGSPLDHLSIVKWLVKQRNAYGGFSSTQDTCVGLQALSQYASATFSGSFDMNIQTKYSSTRNTIKVNDNNKLVLQKHQIQAALPLDIEIEATGKGCALVQGNVKYNEPKPGDETSFMLHVEVQQEKNSLNCLHKVKVCGSYTGEGKSNMALIDVNMVSGFEPVVHELDVAMQSDSITYTQYEFNDGVLSFYFDEFGQKSQCAQFSMEQVAEVEERKPASLIIYDYYEKDNSATKMYSVGECPEVNVVS